MWVEKADVMHHEIQLAFAALSLTCGLLGPWAAAPANGEGPQREVAEVHAVPDGGVLFLSFGGDGELIWDLSRVTDRERANLEFPYLIRFKGQWYCAFREGDIHGNHPSGRARLIRSEDGQAWETAALFEWQGGDIRDPRLSVTADGQLMINSSIYFIGEQKDEPAHWEQPGKRQSVTWLSEDGENWSEPHADPTGFDTWRWDVAWHDGFGYSVGYSGKDRHGALYRTANGKDWQVVVEDFFPDGRGTEAALAFGVNGEAYCLLRPQGREGYGMWGVSQGPDYVEWTWQPLQIDAANNSELESGAAFGERTNSIVGGQKLLRLEDGRILAITAKGGVDLFLVDPERALLTRMARFADGKSYPGLVEHKGEFWVTNAQRAPGYGSVKSGIYLARIKVPSPTSVARLTAVAEEALREEGAGFVHRYQHQLRSVWDPIAKQGKLRGDRAAAARDQLRQALAAYRAASELRQTAVEALSSVGVAETDTLSSFGHHYQVRLREAADPLRRVLADERATMATVQAQLEQLKAAAAALDDAKATQTRAERALASFAPLVEESADGFARLFQARVADEAADLQHALRERDATTAAVREHVEHLLDAAHDYRRVEQARATPIRAIPVTQLPSAVPLGGDSEAWRAGARVGLAVAGDALTLATEPVLSFDADRDAHVRVGKPAKIAELRDAFTVTAWALPRSSDESYRTLIDKGGRDAEFAIRHARTNVNGNHVSVRLYVEGEPHPHEPYTVTYEPEDPAAFDNRWHHYACTYDGAHLRFYLDRQLVGTSAKRSQLDFLKGDLYFGSLATRNEPWHGYIQDVAIWSEALGPARIAAQRHRRLQGDEAGLVGYWPLNEGEGATAHDLTTNSHHGTITAASWESSVVRQGYRIANPIQFRDELEITACTVTWKATPADDSGNTSVTVSYGLTDGADVLPETWISITNGTNLAALASVEGLSEKSLWLKQEMFSNNHTQPPRLHVLSVMVE